MKDQLLHLLKTLTRNFDTLTDDVSESTDDISSNTEDENKCICLSD